MIPRKIAPTKEEERQRTQTRGGRHRSILEQLWPSPLTNGDLMRRTRNQEISARIDKARLWDALKELEEVGYIHRRPMEVYITSAGRAALMKWKENDDA